ncbi:MAG: UDP-N-acetylglucosamine--N-acetylmuramyl-(pentapeptide) pyrophosphoryl-undecaprenol N-acetylglucosamine transferase, partial [Patescibacteria group bacterium]
ANKLMTPAAQVVTVSFEDMLELFPEKKRVYTGTPIRETILQGDRARAHTALNLESNIPTILIFGGGTGSIFLNKLTISSLPELLNFAQVIHITGSGKNVPTIALKEKKERYHSFEFVIDELPTLYAAADLVIARAGIGTLTELAALGKAGMIIPIPHSQQQDNVDYFASKRAIIPLNQEKLSAQSFVEEVRSLLDDKEAMRYLEQQIQKLHNMDALEHVSEIIISYDSEPATKTID